MSAIPGGQSLAQSREGGAAGRIVLLSSEGHRFAPKEGIQFDNLPARRVRSAEAYGQSKLANILMAVGLTERLKGTAVTANAVHPVS